MYCVVREQGATDAARSAADIVLTKPGLATIVTAIEIARIVFGRMKSFITYRIAGTRPESVSPCCSVPGLWSDLGLLGAVLAMLQPRCSYWCSSSWPC